MTSSNDVIRLFTVSHECGILRNLVCRFDVHKSLSIFFILEHPCSYLVYHYLYGVFLYEYTIFWSNFPLRESEQPWQSIVAMDLTCFASSSAFFSLDNLVMDSSWAASSSWSCSALFSLLEMSCSAYEAFKRINKVISEAFDNTLKSFRRVCYHNIYLRTKGQIANSFSNKHKIYMQRVSFISLTRHHNLPSWEPFLSLRRLVWDRWFLLPFSS